MATVLIAVLPARGHVGPTIPAAEALTEAGHTVRVLTGTAYASRFAAVGAAVQLLPSESDFDDTDLTASFPERADLRGIRLARFDLTNFVTAMGPQLAVIDGLLDGVDVVLCDPLLMAGIPLSMRALRPAVLVLGFIPFSIPFPGLPPATTRRERLKDRAVTAIARRVVAPVQDVAQREVRSITGQGLQTGFMEWAVLADGVLQQSCPAFEPLARHASVPVDFVGPLASSSTADHARPEWWSDLTGSRPVVFVTQGSVANTDLGDLVIPTLAALADEDVLVVAGTGGADLGGYEPSANARIADWLPYDELFPHCALLVTNGGYGGVHHALRHGVPLVCVGATEDKRAVALRVQRSGAGLGLGRARISERGVRRVVRRVLTDPRYRRRAAEIADELAATPGAAGVVTAVEHHSRSGPQSSCNGRKTDC